ncbi:hypothetical protein Q6348_10590 [Isoptericola sp. b441]|uniref:DUF306 domain-containing protein n=1 Tax=Actinotalea lenta TaxID=3064654 RepID=A0ABT9D9R5_9CELL|nr:hypothetical protein [Isoptericola sp. b441]MDO8107643.1 hypothetical protein [Isoptericola sp. b441]
MNPARLVVLPLIAALSACAAIGGGPALTPLDGPVMRYTERSARGGMDALVRGRLVLEGDCLYLDGEERYPVVWPAGATWDGERSAVVSPNGAVLPVGTDVSGGGGYLSLADVEQVLGAEASQLAQRCVDNSDGEVAFFNNASDAVGPAT